jgi:hypothetical protein
MEENFKQPKTFRNQPAEIELSTGATVKICDMPYGERKKIVKKMMEIVFAIETAPISIELFKPQITNLVTSGMSAVDAINKIKGELFSIYDSSDNDNVKELLSMFTGGSLTSEDIDKLGDIEVKTLLQWCIDRSFQAEKNLEASLRSILSPATGGGSI